MKTKNIIIIISLFSFTFCTNKTNDKDVFIKNNEINNCLLSIKLNVNNIFYLNQDKHIELIIKNNRKDSIKLPEWLYAGRYSDSQSELIFEIKKIYLFGIYKELDFENSDYDYILYDRKFKILNPENSINYIQNVEFLHNLKEANNYKIRAILRLGKFIECEEIKSEWIEFKVIK